MIAYLDYSATTPLDPRVLEAMTAVSATHFGNASSVHSFGRESRALLESSREKVARLLGARTDEIYFTSGGTEANNHALRGLAAAGATRGKNEIVTSAVEHHAVLHPAESLRKSGFTLKLLPVDSFGRVDPSEVKKAVGPRTALVSLMLANNEVGTLNPIREIGAFLREAGIPFHSDIVQAAGKIEVNVGELDIDVASVSAHKFYGPKGIGAIYIRNGILIESLIEGGSQESNRRAGTENVPSAVGFARACEIAREVMSESIARISLMRQRLRSKLQEGFDGILFNGHPNEGLPHIVSVSFDSAVNPLDGDALIMGLDLRGVAVTSGSACTSGSLQPSHVLLAMGRDEKTARATVRFSIGRFTTEEEIDYAVDCLRDVVSQIRKANGNS
jgi:cysteine desulfurase